MDYRLELAEGFLKEAKDDYTSRRYRSCVDNSQLSIENSAKAVLAYFGPLEKTHNPSEALNNLLARQVLSDILEEKIRQLALLASQYGMREHFLTDYGDEVQRISPWKLFSEEDAKKAKETAETCYDIARQIKEIVIGHWSLGND